MSVNPLYGVWNMMIQRCHNPNNHKFPSYGARGIAVCDRWRKSFEDFLSDMGPRPERHSIERKDSNKGYEPDNCVWADAKTQAANRRKITVCKRGHLLTKPNGCVVCQRDRNRAFMRRTRSQNPDRWRENG